VLLKIMFRVKVTGTENIPKSGGAIVCGNHISAWDPVLIAVAVKRNLRFIGKKELFENKALAWLFHSLGAFPVDRENTDMVAYKTAIKLLQGGQMLMLFSQGHRQKTMELSSNKAGVAFFGIKAQVPIVPVGITASYKLFSKASIRIGKPIYLDRYYGARLKTELLEEITEDTVNEIIKLTGEGK
jgi:1-acyl-sn-glycerol-3-phosphate acyltransferase